MFPALTREPVWPPDLGAELRYAERETEASRMLKRCLFGYVGHRCLKLQAASAQAPTHLLPSPTPSWGGGARLAKAEKREETGWVWGAQEWLVETGEGDLGC